MMIQKKEVAQAEDTPAYAVLQQYGLLDASYRKEHFDDIFDNPDDITANSSRAENIKKRFRWGVYWTPGKTVSGATERGTNPSYSHSLFHSIASPGCGLIIYVSFTP